jgi:hypothetical protein
MVLMHDTRLVRDGDLEDGLCHVHGDQRSVHGGTPLSDFGLRGRC